MWSSSFRGTSEPARKAETLVAKIRMLAAMAGGVVVYLFPHRYGLLGWFSLVFILAVGYNFAIIAMCRRDRWSARMSKVASLVDIVAVTVGCSVLGGAQSDLRNFYFLVPVSAAVRFGPALTIGLTSIASLSYLSLCLLDPGAFAHTSEPASFVIFLLVTAIASGYLADLVIRSRDELERRVQARTEELVSRTRELQVANQQLSLQSQELRQMDTRKDQFLSIISHELRTPINAITGFGSILDDGVAGPLTEEQHTYLRKMLAGATHLLALIDDLLDMSRIQAGKLSLAPAPEQVLPVFAEALDALHPLAQQKCLQLRSEFPETLPELVIDGQRLRQVIANLVSNACKFTPEGGTVVVRVRLEEHELCCEIEDSGIGIVRESLPKLFSPFSQVDMSATRKVGGTGLGLSICKALIEAQGGRIGVPSEGPDQGSTFWFSLPLSAAVSEPHATGGSH